jgi:hypothetical protein
MVRRYPLGNQVGDIGRVFGVVFVPAPVQKLPVVLDRYPGNQDHHRRGAKRRWKREDGSKRQKRREERREQKMPGLGW